MIILFNDNTGYNVQATYSTRERSTVFVSNFFQSRTNFSETPYSLAAAQLLLLHHFQFEFCCVFVILSVRRHFETCTRLCHFTFLQNIPENIKYYPEKLRSTITRGTGKIQVFKAKDWGRLLHEVDYYTSIYGTLFLLHLNSIAWFN